MDEFKCDHTLVTESDGWQQETGGSSASGRALHQTAEPGGQGHDGGLGGPTDQAGDTVQCE